MNPARVLTALLVVASAALLLLSGCGEDSSKRRLVVYSPHGEDILRDFKERFEAAHPDVRVETFDMGAAKVLERLQAERERPQADLWWGAPAALFMTAADDDLLEPYEPSWKDALESHQHDDAFRWTGVFKLPIVLGYNREVTDPASLPSSWDEVVAPRYADQIVIRHPLASGTMTTLFTSMILKSVRDSGSEAAGFDWLLELDANTISYEPNPQAMYDAVARDPAGKWTLWGLSDLVYQSQNPADPLPFGVKVLEGETPVILDGIALVRGGNNPDDARAFYEFVTTPESLAFLATSHAKIPVRADVPADMLPEALRETGETPMIVDPRELAARSKEWMKRWDLEVEGQGAAAREAK